MIPYLRQYRNDLSQELRRALRHVLLQSNKIRLEYPCDDRTSTLLLSMEQSDDTDGDTTIVDAATRAVRKVTSIPDRAALVQRLSVLYRHKGHILKSQRIITDFLNHDVVESELGAENYVQRLQLSAARNKIYQFDYDGAYQMISTWSLPKDGTSDLDLRLRSERLLTTARILRGCGQFHEALECFEGYLKSAVSTEEQRSRAIAHLSDCCCEIEYANRTELSRPLSRLPFLDHARHRLEAAMYSLNAGETPSFAHRHLWLSLIEIDIQQGRLRQAEGPIDALLDVYAERPNLGLDDKVSHIRTIIAKARVSRTGESEEWWKTALAQNAAYNPDEEEVFTCGIIHLALAAAQALNDSSANVRSRLERAIGVLQTKLPRFLIPGLGTYIFEDIKQSLAEKGIQLGLFCCGEGQVLRS